MSAKKRSETDQTKQRPGQWPTRRSGGWTGHWDLDRLLEISAAFDQARITVVGDVGVDRYTLGSVERISPEAPVPIVLVQEERLKLGLAANVADNIRALGGEAHLFGVVGRDRPATDFLRLLKQGRMPTTGIVIDRGRRTTVKERILSERQQLLRVDYESGSEISAASRKTVGARARGLVRQTSALIIEDYHKGLFDRDLLQSLIRDARKAGRVVAVDPHPKTPLDWYQGATFLTPNLKEAELLSGLKISDEKSIENSAATILRKTQAEAVVITLGRDGMLIHSRASLGEDLGKTVQIPTFAREVYDVSCAGDTVIAVLTLGLAVGASMTHAAMLGNIAAGVEVAKRGTATVSPAELREAIGARHRGLNASG